MEPIYNPLFSKMDNYLKTLSKKDELFAGYRLIMRMVYDYLDEKYEELEGKKINEILMKVIEEKVALTIPMRYVDFSFSNEFKRVQKLLLFHNYFSYNTRELKLMREVLYIPMELKNFKGLGELLEEILKIYPDEATEMKMLFGKGDVIIFDDYKRKVYPKVVESFKDEIESAKRMAMKRVEKAMEYIK